MKVHPRIGVSTWSVNRRVTEQNVSLLELPSEVASHGLSKLEICHFHFPTTDDAYLAELRNALTRANVEFYTMLIDAGDITAADPQKRVDDEALIARWLDIAAKCGASRARVIAGDAIPDPDGIALATSAAALSRLSRRADAGGVRLVVENWHALLDRPKEVLDLLDELEGRVALKLDFGNWKGDRKYADLALIAPHSADTHAKAYFPEPGQIDLADFQQCLRICDDAGFSGPHILIYDSPGDEWAGLDKMREIVLPFVS